MITADDIKRAGEAHKAAVESQRKIADLLDHAREREWNGRVDVIKDFAVKQEEIVRGLEVMFS